MKPTILPSRFAVVLIAFLAAFGACHRAGAADPSLSAPGAGAEPAAIIAVSIAIPLHNSLHERELSYAGKQPHFHVLVTNTSDHPQNIWREWCSWGYYALSFEITDADGKTRVIRKRGRDWSWNYPDYWTLPPHESLVLDVNFAETSGKDMLVKKPTPFAIWEPFPHPTGGPKKFTMRAIFEIPADDDTKKSSVWTGRVVSEAAQYTATYSP